MWHLGHLFAISNIFALKPLSFGEIFSEIQRANLRRKKFFINNTMKQKHESSDAVRKTKI